MDISHDAALTDLLFLFAVGCLRSFCCNVLLSCDELLGKFRLRENFPQDI